MVTTCHTNTPPRGKDEELLRILGARKMAQRANPDDPSSIPKTHMLEQVDSSRLSSDLHMCTEACMPTYLQYLKKGH